MLGAATGEVTAWGMGVRFAFGETIGDAIGFAAGCCTSGSFKALKSGLLMTNAPSRSSVRANHIPSPLGPPIVNLCEALSSGEVVNVMTS